MTSGAERRHWLDSVERHQRELDLIEQLIALYRGVLTDAIGSTAYAAAEREGLSDARELFDAVLAKLQITVLSDGKIRVGG